ncbi:MAG: FkbM family methyltransferase, partial [Bdellovibrionales bacterium]|nr:FkbM family methyltransferase [Bdellovibrionales bacterium]
AHVLIEPIAEHEPALIEVCAKFPNATHIIAAAAASTGTTQLRINKDLRHSSIVEDVIPSERHIFREIPTIALDDLVAQSNLQGPFVIKIDVDGREVDVLQGAKQALKKTEYAIIESTLFGQIYDVMDFMRSQGFVVYDIVELAYRPLDGALWQVDMAFVKENSIYRKDMRYE